MGTTRNRAGVRGAFVFRAESRSKATGRTRRKRRSAARRSRWRLCVRALAKQCFASKAPSPMGARSAHPCTSRSCLPPCSGFGQLPAAAEREQEFKVKRQKAESKAVPTEVGIYQARSSGIKYPPRSQERVLRRRAWPCRTVGAMGPVHAPGGLGRTPNPGLAVCAGQRTRARRLRAPMDGLRWSSISGHSQGAFRPPALREAQVGPARWRCAADGCTSPQTFRYPRLPRAGSGTWRTAILP